MEFERRTTLTIILDQTDITSLSAEFGRLVSKMIPEDTRSFGEDFPVLDLLYRNVVK